MLRRPIKDLPGMGGRLKRLRTDTGLIQDAVAARMRQAGHPTWTHNTVGAIEADQRYLRLTEGFDLAAIYTVSLYRLAYGPHRRDLVATQVQRLVHERRYLRARLHELDQALASHEAPVPS